MKMEPVPDGGLVLPGGSDLNRRDRGVIPSSGGLPAGLRCGAGDRTGVCYPPRACATKACHPRPYGAAMRCGQRYEQAV
jgi:hypothetical protein